MAALNTDAASSNGAEEQSAEGLNATRGRRHGRYTRHRHHPQPGRAVEKLGRPVPVDTGATDSLVPRSCIEVVGTEPEGQRVYETADGREVRMDFAIACIEFMGDVTAGRIIIGEDGVEPLLGVTALESAGIEVDPVSQRLKRLPALRLKHLAPP